MSCFGTILYPDNYHNRCTLLQPIVFYFYLVYPICTQFRLFSLGPVYSFGPENTYLSLFMTTEVSCHLVFYLLLHITDACPIVIISYKYICTKYSPFMTTESLFPTGVILKTLISLIDNNQLKYRRAN